MLYFCAFSKELNRSIPGENNLEEKCESEQKDILKLIALHDILIFGNGSLNNELTLKMHDLDVTQETTT